MAVTITRPPTSGDTSLNNGHDDAHTEIADATEDIYQGPATDEMVYWDADGTYTSRKAILTIRKDTGSSAITAMSPGVYITNRTKGDNAGGFTPAPCVFLNARDRTDVTTDGARGSPVGLMVDVWLNRARSNSPNDDANGIMVSNSSDAANKGTDALYIGHGAAFTTQHEWITGVQVAANTDFAFFNSGYQGTGLELRGTYANYGIDLKSGTFTTGAGIRLPNNTNILARNAADGADIALMKLDASNNLLLQAGLVTLTSTGALVGVGSVNNSFGAQASNVLLNIEPTSGSRIPLRVKMNTSPSVNVLEIQNSAAAIKTKLTSAFSWVFSDAALSTSATDGFIYIPTSAGAPVGTPTTQTGTVAMEYDTTNNQLKIYNGGWKSVTLS